MPTEELVMSDGLWRYARGGGIFGAGSPSSPPPGPSPSSLLAFGTTLVGQSYARYKNQTLSGGSPRYNAVEDDTGFVLDGTLRKGGAVTREYKNGGPGTWTDAQKSFFRSDQPIIWSYKQSNSVSLADFKDDFRAWYQSKDPATTPFVWLAFHHEWDKVGTNQPGDPDWDIWYDRNAAIREVMNEAEFAGRDDVRFGFMSTGSPWRSNVGLGDHRHWRNIWDRMEVVRGDTDTWDYLGSDRYNNQWDDPSWFTVNSEWFHHKDEAHEFTGLPHVLGEMGTARPHDPPGTDAYSKAELDQARVDWQRQMLIDITRERDYFDAACWWRVPANSGFSAPFSTIMATPIGYDAELAAASITGPPHGFDAQGYVDVFSEFMVTSIDNANYFESTGDAPHTISYQP